MSGKVFDKTLSGLPDLEIKVDPEQMILKTDDQEAGDELVVPESPTKKEYTMRTSEIFVMRQKKAKAKQNIKLEVERKIEKPIEEHENMRIGKTVFLDGISKEEKNDDLDIDIEPLEVPTTKRGKRGNDKKPRKKRVLTDKQKENLKKAREKSLAVRRAKKAAKATNKQKPKSEPIKEMPKPTAPIPIQQQAPMSFDHFCNLMDRYEDRNKKKHATTREPHPNKKIPYTEKPRPPIQKVQRNEVKVRQPPTNFDPYSILNNNRNSNSSLFGSAFGY